MGAGHSLEDFYSRLKKELNKKARGSTLKIDRYFLVKKQPYQQVFQVKLFGYNCSIDLQSKNVIVDLDSLEFSSALKLTNMRKTPTISNLLADKTLMELIKNKNELDVKHIEELTHHGASFLEYSTNALRRRIKQVLKVEDEGFGYAIFSLGNPIEGTYAITALSSIEQIENEARKISKKKGFYHSEVIEYLLEEQRNISCYFNRKLMPTSLLRNAYNDYCIDSINDDNSSNQVTFFMLSILDEQSFKTYINQHLKHPL
jgi:hypothetical protein